MPAGKRIIIILLVALGFFTKAHAGLLPKFKIDPLGNIASFWINSQNELKYSRSKYAEPLTLYTFTQEVASYDIKSENDKFYLTFETRDPDGISKVFTTLSKDNGHTFAAPFLIADGGKTPSLTICQNFVLVAWTQEEAIHFMRSENDSNYFNNPIALNITDEALSSPVLTTNQFGNISLCFLSQKKGVAISQIIYTRYPEFKPRVIYESHDKIINLGINNTNENLFVFWQNNYLSRNDSYFLNSIDQGEHFGSVKSVNCQDDLLDIIYLNEKFCALAFQPQTSRNDESKPLLYEIDSPQIAAPQIIEPSNNAILNSADLKLKLSLPSSDPLLFKISISKNENFLVEDTLHFQNLVLPGDLQSIAFTFPHPFGDGTYFLRAYATDGLSTSPRTETYNFKIDTASPEVLSLEAEKDNDSIFLKVKISEYPASFSINGNPVQIETNQEATKTLSEDGIYFEHQIDIEPNENEITFILTDLAGNQSISTREISSLLDSFDIQVSNPKENDWFKPGSTIFIEANVSSRFDIADEKESAIVLNGERLENTLLYSKQDNNLFGFINIPAGMLDGRYSGSILLNDISENEIKGEFNLNVDGTPPTLSLEPGQPCYGNPETIFIPISDEGAGVDPAGTIIKISDISFEGTASYESGQLEVKPDFLLHAGTYNLEISPRDAVGNVGETYFMNLIVDSTAPMLTLAGTYESVINSPKMTIQGNIIEESPSHATIFINKKEYETFSLTGNYFSREINLVSGRNEIIIEVFDKSNNKTSATICTTANFTQTSRLISNCIHGPNPFSPEKDLPGAFSAKGKGMVFSYSLFEPANIQINIYDITGTLIWTKRVSNTSSGVAAWSGEDAFGKIVGNGIYPYVFMARSANAKEAKRGKILVIR
jgi:hypothetical protein